MTQPYAFWSAWISATTSSIRAILACTQTHTQARVRLCACVHGARPCASPCDHTEGTTGSTKRIWHRAAAGIPSGNKAEGTRTGQRRQRQAYPKRVDLQPQPLRVVEDHLLEHLQHGERVATQWPARLRKTHLLDLPLPEPAASYHTGEAHTVL
jgi:hypothetical protein